MPTRELIMLIAAGRHFELWFTKRLRGAVLITIGSGVTLGRHRGIG